MFVARAAAGASVVALLAVGGCAGDSRDASDGVRTLNIHASSTLLTYADQIRAEQLAVEDVGARAGRYRIKVVVHDEARGTDRTDPERVRRNAEEAARDPDAIAYVGDANSSSTMISAPILNRAGLLQVSPDSTYVGLTRSEGAAPGEPEKYRPTGRKTFARVIPADHVQARAAVGYALHLGVRRLGVVADDSVYGRGLARLVLSAASDMAVETIDGTGQGDVAAQAQWVTAEGADAVYFGACVPPGDMLALADAQGDVKTLTGDCYASINSFLPRPFPQLDGRFFVTGPGGGLDQTPAGRRWVERWRDVVGTVPDDSLMFFYETMSAVLAAIERAGVAGDDRAAVVDEFFATRDRDSLVGRYSIDPHGDSTLRSYGGFAWRGGRLAFDRVLRAGG